MIVNQESYDKAKTVWSNIDCICDYCGINFTRSKRNIKVGRTIIAKESCNSKECAKQKREESQIVKYGVKNAGGSKTSQSKAKATWMKNFGVDNPMQLQEVKDKIKTTCQLRYEKDSFVETKECRDALKRYCLDNYQVENIGQSDIVKGKIKETCLRKYGVDHPRKNNDVYAKFINKFFEKHGVYNLCDLDDHQEKREKTCLERYGFDHPTKNTEIQNKIRQTCIEKYGKFPVNCFGKTQEIIQEFIKGLGFDCYSDRSLLNGREIDIYIPSKKLAIEYCGLYWHNEMSPCPRPKGYHQEKFEKLQLKGIQLITIFEDEWLEKQEICRSIIASKLNIFSKRIYARKCQVRNITSDVARKFLNQHHLQGCGKVQFASGLFYENELVACASFGKHHRQNQDCVVINRFCSCSDMQIVGGIAKLFSHIRKQIVNTKIVTWSDNRWSDGDIYKKLGFELEEVLDSDYSYYKFGSFAKRKSKQSMKKSNTGCPKEITEREWCLEQNYVRIWDCGKKRWTMLN